MDVFSDVFDFMKKTVGGIFNGTENSTTTTEYTVAPSNIHPMQPDLTERPLEEPVFAVVPDPVIGDASPLDVIGQLLDTFDDGNSFDSTDTVDGDRIVRIDGTPTGRTIEFMYETLTELSPKADLTSEKNNDQKIDDNCSYVNIYILAAIILIIAIAVSIGAIIWCKKNKLKLMKRNEYPVVAVINNDYVDPKSLKRDKMKNLS